MSELALSTDQYGGVTPMTALREREELHETFIGDAEDNLATMEALVLMLETSPAEEAMLNALFRSAHTLKGNAACMSFEPYFKVAHAAEDVLERVRKHTIAFDGTVAAALLRTVDILRRMTPEAVAGATELPEDAVELIATLEEICAGEGKRPAALDRNEIGDETLPTSTRAVRVSRQKLDELSSMLDQLYVLQRHLQEVIGTQDEYVHDCQLAADEVIREIRRVVNATRVVQVGPLFRQFARIARDAGRTLHKDVRLIIENEHAEVDTVLLEGVREALVHMIRNAVDHGIESAEERARAGKPPFGTLTLRAEVNQTEVAITLTDDGAGLDWSAIRRRATEHGLFAHGQIVKTDQLLQVIFEPGFSTAKRVSALSGRGVGMDVVKSSVTSHGGHIEIQSAAGLGTTIQLIFPIAR